MITIIGIILVFITVTITSFLAGTMFYNKKDTIFLSPYDVTVITVYGLIIQTIFLFTVSIIKLSPLLFFLLPVASLFYRSKQIRGYRLLFSKKDTPYCAFIIVSCIYFAGIITRYGWPPIGDITFGHGPLVSLILENQKLVFTYLPFNSDIIHTPLGFHVYCAYISRLFSLYPAESIFIFGGLICVLLSSSIFSVIKIKTGSTVASFVAGASCYLVGQPNLERWVFGYFLNGPYPNIYVLLSVVLMAHYIINDDRDHLQLIFISLFQLIVYPTYLIYTVVYVALTHYSIIYVHLLKNLRLWLLVFAVLFVGALSLSDYIYGFIHYNLNSIINGMWTNYQVPPSFFTDNLVGLSVTFAALLCLYIVFKKKKRGLETYYLIVLVPVTLSMLLGSRFPLFFIFLPDRSVIINSMLSLPIICIFIQDSSRLDDILLMFNHTTSIRNAVYFLVIILVLPSLFMHLSFDLASNYNKYLLSTESEDDLNALKWLDANAGGDLILNDRSYMSFYLESMSLKRMVYFIWDTHDEAYYDKINQFWVDPYNYPLLSSLLEEYGVKYLFISSASQFFNRFGSNADSLKTSKLYTSSLYIEYLENAVFLRQVYRQNYTAIYEYVSGEYTTYEKVPNRYSFFSFRCDDFTPSCSYSCNNTVKVHGDVTISDGFVDNCFNFSGGYIYTDCEMLDEIASNNVVIEFWFKTVPTQRDSTLLDFKDQILVKSSGNGTLSFDADGSSDDESIRAFGFADNQWHKVAIYWIRGDWSILLVRVDENLYGPLYQKMDLQPFNTQFFIGSDYNESHPYSGCMDNFIIRRPFESEYLWVFDKL